jgi:hypothetical protein
MCPQSTGRRCEAKDIGIARGIPLSNTNQLLGAGLGALVCGGSIVMIDISMAIG